MKILGKGLILRVGLLKFQNNWVSIICLNIIEGGRKRGEGGTEGGREKGK